MSAASTYRCAPEEIPGACHVAHRQDGRRGHAVCAPAPAHEECCAAGPGTPQNGASTETDASGNPILADIGTYLRSEFKKYFKVGAVLP